MKLSKNEMKYRAKFIAENHYNKKEQRIFDTEAPKNGRRYKEIYMKRQEGFVYAFMTLIAMERLSEPMKRVGVSAEKAAKAISRLATAFCEPRLCRKDNRR